MLPELRDLQTICREVGNLAAVSLLDPLEIAEDAPDAEKMQQLTREGRNVAGRLMVKPVRQEGIDWAFMARIANEF